MFERYTEKARRAIFFARFEASGLGGSYIEPEHLLLGLLRADPALAHRVLRSIEAIQSVRERIEAHFPAGEKLPTSADMPLNAECKRVLEYAAEEADRIDHKDIGPEHLLLGLLREEKCFAAEVLQERGLSIGQLREGRQGPSPEPSA